MSKRNLIDTITVKNPCSENWNEMKGSDRVRHCGHCDFKVHNISALTRKEAMRLVRDSGGRICVHYVKNPKDNTPLFAEKLYKITRRAGLAAGVLGASLSLSTLAHAQGKPVIPNNQPAVKTVDKKNDPAVRNAPSTTTEPMISEPDDTLVDGKMSFVEYRTKLHSAVFKNDADEVLRLLSDGADVNAIDSTYNQLTPLFLAVENGNFLITQRLLNYGAKINHRDGDRQTAIMRLDDDATLSLANLLLDNSAEVNLIDNELNTPLILAAGSVIPEVLKLLIERTEKIDARNVFGRTALMEAADQNNFENVLALLEAGAKVDVEDADDETAFSLTTDERIKELLKSYGAKTGKDPD